MRISERALCIQGWDDAICLAHQFCSLGTWVLPWGAVCQSHCSLCYCCVCLQTLALCFLSHSGLVLKDFKYKKIGFSAWVWGRSGRSMLAPSRGIDSLLVWKWAPSTFGLLKRQQIKGRITCTEINAVTIKRHHWRWMQIMISDQEKCKEPEGLGWCLLFTFLFSFHAQTSLGSGFWRGLQVSLPVFSPFQKGG